MEYLGIVALTTPLAIEAVGAAMLVLLLSVMYAITSVAVKSPLVVGRLTACESLAVLIT